jgi:hypothetical protein
MGGPAWQRLSQDHNPGIPILGEGLDQRPRTDRLQELHLGQRDARPATAHEMDSSYTVLKHVDIPLRTRGHVPNPHCHGRERRLYSAFHYRRRVENWLSSGPATGGSIPQALQRGNRTLQKPSPPSSEPSSALQCRFLENCEHRGRRIEPNCVPPLVFGAEEVTSLVQRMAPRRRQPLSSHLSAAALTRAANSRFCRLPGVTCPLSVSREVSDPENTEPIAGQDSGRASWLDGISHSNTERDECQEG